MIRVIRRKLSAWLVRNRLKTIPGWHEAYEATQRARAKHGRSRQGLKAMSEAINAALAAENFSMSPETPTPKEPAP